MCHCLVVFHFYILCVFCFIQRLGRIQAVRPDLHKLPQLWSSGTPILIRGKYERRFRDGDVFFNILQISLLSESKNDVANKITINLCRNDLNGPICELLHQHLGSSDENCGALAFNIYDPEINRSIMLTSRHKIPINRALVEMLQSEDIQFKIN